MPDPARPRPANPPTDQPPTDQPPTDQPPTDALTALGHDDGPWPALLHAIDPDAVHGRVVRTDRGAASVQTRGGLRRVTWTHADDPPATGDWVAVAPPSPGRSLDGGDRLLGIAPRRTAITRPQHHRGFRAEGRTDQVLAANPDLVGVVVALDGELNLRRLERGVVMAHESGAVPLVVLTKADLAATPDDLARDLDLARRTAPGVDVVVCTATTGEGVEELRAHLQPHRTLALLGASGAGKSTLVNALVGHQVLATGAVRAGDAKGRHTTTHRELVVVPGGGCVLDTPGLRTLSLGQVGEGLDAAFPEVEELTGDCRFGDCRHDGEPGCAVLAAVDEGRLPADRLEGWRRIRAESEHAALRADTAAWRAAGRSFGKVAREARREAGRRRDGR